MTRDAIDNPEKVVGAGRQPAERTESNVEKLDVFRERHADGSAHFRVAVKLSANARFKVAKATLQNRHKVPSHWSCSHRQWWSAVWYGHVPFPRKPVAHEAPVGWRRDGKRLDVFEESQEPFNAHALKAARERGDLSAAALGKRRNFTKLDFTAMVIARHLHTKATFMTYAQRFDTCRSGPVRPHMSPTLVDKADSKINRFPTPPPMQNNDRMLCNTRIFLTNPSKCLSGTNVVSVALRRLVSRHGGA